MSPIAAGQPAFDLLKSIREATAGNAAPLPSKESTQAVWQGIGFQLGGIRLTAAMGDIEEILKLPKLTVLPVVKSWMLGVANVRGRLIPVIDLHEYFGLAPTLPRAQWRVLVVEHQDVVAGLLVEQSLGIQHFVDDCFEPAGDSELGELKPYISGAFRQGGRIFYQLDIQSILQAERFFDVAETTN
ncbi:MAG: chemotaxis protein CheW [Pseudomonadota bacterium]